MRTRLGLCALTQDHPDLVGLILDTFADVVDESIIGVDARVDPSTMQPIVRRATHTVRMEVTTPDDITPAKWWLSEQLDCPWVLFVDTDEIPSNDLIAWLRRFKRDETSTTHVSFRRRWLWPTVATYLLDDPWRDDPQTRLVRVDQQVARCGRSLHETVLVGGSGRVQPQCLYHLDTVLNSVDERRKKVRR